MTLLYNLLLIWANKFTYGQIYLIYDDQFMENIIQIAIVLSSFLKVIRK